MKQRTLFAALAWLLTPGCAEKISTPCDSCGGDCVADFIPEKGIARHVDGAVEYSENPPVSGDHNACWSNWGVHAEEVATERWVHNLEHGGLVFLYDCPEGCTTEVAALEEMVNGLPEGRALLTPASGLPAPFAAISWENRLLTGCLDIAAMQSFFDAHVSQAPEDTTANPPAACPP